MRRTWPRRRIRDHRAVAGTTWSWDAAAAPGSAASAIILPLPPGEPSRRVGADRCEEGEAGRDVAPPQAMLADRQDEIVAAVARRFAAVFAQIGGGSAAAEQRI